MMERTNLLPQTRIRSLAREYYLRLAVIGIVLFSILVVVASIMLVPTYAALQASIKERQIALAGVESDLNSSGEAALSNRLEDLSANVDILMSLKNVSTASGVLKDLLAIRHPGILISSFDFTRGEGRDPSVATVHGTAQTRDALRSYQLALQGNPLVGSVDLPVSAFAQDSNISFLVTITLKL